MSVHGVLHGAQEGLFDRVGVARQERGEKLAHADESAAAKCVDLLQNGGLAAARVAVQHQDTADGDALQQGVGSLPLNGRQYELFLHSFEWIGRETRLPCACGGTIPGRNNTPLPDLKVGKWTRWN